MGLSKYFKANGEFDEDAFAQDFVPDEIKETPNHECEICHEMTNNLGGNPLKWGVALPYIGGNGATKVYHMGCVVIAVEYYMKEGGRGDGQ